MKGNPCHFWYAINCVIEEVVIYNRVFKVSLAQVL